MLQIWGRTNSINVQKVLWCCAELGLAYERLDAGGQFGVVNTPDYLALNPNALVPTIDDDGFILWESNAIVRYLAHKHSLGTLCPTDLKERYAGERWMDWQTTALQPAVRAAFMGLVRTPEEKRDMQAIGASLKETARMIAMFEQQLAKTAYAAGGRFTMGDIPVGAALYRCFALGIDRSDFPNAARWQDRLAERPGFREHIMQPLS
jgi:glutathione S-transferase